MLLPNIKVLSEEGNISTYSRHPLQKVFGGLGPPLTPGSSSASSPYPFGISVAWAWCGPSCTTKHQQQRQEHTHSYLHTYAHSLHPQLPIHFYAAMHTAYTHSYLYTFMQPCTQPTPTVTYTLLCSHAHSLHPQLPIHFYAAMHTAYTHSYLYTFMQPKSWIVWQHLGLVDGCLLATSVSLFLLFSQVLHSSLKKKNAAYLI